MLREVRFYPLLLGGGRGAWVSLAALEQLLLALSRLALRLPRLAGGGALPRARRAGGRVRGRGAPDPRLKHKPG
jgi:hypothetical protein